MPQISIRNDCGNGRKFYYRLLIFQHLAIVRALKHVDVHGNSPTLYNLQVRHGTHYNKYVVLEAYDADVSDMYGVVQCYKLEK